MKFRKKSVVIEAVQWTGDNTQEVQDFLEGHTRENGFVSAGKSIIIPTLEGDHEAKVGDFIIRGIKREYYPCKPDIFEMTYESVNE